MNRGASHTRHLRLVVDNTGEQPENSDSKVLKEVLASLENIPNGYVKAAFEYCLNLEVNQKSDKYTDFMARNYRFFQPVLSQIPLDRDYQRKHELLNYFMMMVYLEVMVHQLKAINDTGFNNQPNDDRLVFWVKEFANRLMGAERSNKTPENNHDGPDFGSRIRKVIENA